MSSPFGRCPLRTQPPQDILRRWEKSAREGSYITNRAAALSRCTSEIQKKMGEHINFLQEVMVKGKAPREVTDAIKDLKDLSPFHTSVSIALGTSLQHLTICPVCKFCYPQERFLLALSKIRGQTGHFE